MEKTINTMAAAKVTTKVSPSSIRSELDRLRKESDTSRPDPGSSTGQGTIRATLSNIIILAPHTPHHQDTDCPISECIENLAGMHPSRFFVVYAGSELQEPLLTEITSRELSGTEAETVQTEEIHISVHPDSLHIIKNLILSHLVPDIETICLEISGVREHPFRTQILETLKDLIDTCISYAPSRLLTGSKTVSSETYCKPLNYKYLCWPLLEKWRLLISEQYDSQEAQNLIENISDIWISFSENPENNASVPDEALTLAAWILSSLKLFPNTIIESDSAETRIACTSTSKQKSRYNSI
jgi:hypothetical protein